MIHDTKYILTTSWISLNCEWYSIDWYRFKASVLELLLYVRVLYTVSLSIRHFWGDEVPYKIGSEYLILSRIIYNVWTNLFARAIPLAVIRSLPQFTLTGSERHAVFINVSKKYRNMYKLHFWLHLFSK